MQEVGVSPPMNPGALWLHFSLFSRTEIEMQFGGTGESPGSNSWGQSYLRLCDTGKSSQPSQVPEDVTTIVHPFPSCSFSTIPLSPAIAKAVIPPTVKI